MLILPEFSWLVLNQMAGSLNKNYNLLKFVISTKLPILERMSERES